MYATAGAAGDHSEAAILGRLIRPERDDLTPDAARAILKLEFDQEDRTRMHELSAKAKEGALTPAEEAELSSYRGVGRLLELMRSKARRSLKRAGVEP
jgi:uncharacterized protein YnzC (UPF0291/DUF896 family)